MVRLLARGQSPATKQNAQPYGWAFRAVVELYRYFARVVGFAGTKVDCAAE
jgi:hypothetical protein